MDNDASQESFEESKTRFRDKLWKFLPSWVKWPFLVLYFIAIGVTSIGNYTGFLPPFQRVKEFFSLQKQVINTQSISQEININPQSEAKIKGACSYEYCSEFSSDKMQTDWVNIDSRLSVASNDQGLFCATKGGPFPVKMMDSVGTFVPSHQIKLSFIPTQEGKLNLVLAYKGLYRVTIGDGDMRSIALHRNKNFPMPNGNYIKQAPATSFGDKAFLKEEFKVGEQIDILVNTNLSTTKSELEVEVKVDNEERIVFQLTEVGIKDDYKTAIQLGFFVTEEKSCAKLVNFGAREN